MFVVGAILGIVGQSLYAASTESAPTFGPTKVRAMYHPVPPYPYEARVKGIEGSGVLIMHLNPKIGAVTSMTIEKSTGHTILDRAAMPGVSKWKFKVPLQSPNVRCPIRYFSPESLKALQKQKSSWYGTVSSNQASGGFQRTTGQQDHRLW